MKSLRTLLLLSFAFLLASCGATKYAPAGTGFLSGHTGYWEMPLDATTYQVSFAGNDNTGADIVDRYALYRSAEITVSSGYDYFVVLDQQQNATTTMNTTSNGSHQTEIEHDVDPQTGKVVPVAVTTNTHSTSTTTETSHVVTKTIRMFKGTFPSDNLGAYDAKSMLAVMGPSIQR